MRGGAFRGLALVLALAVPALAQDRPVAPLADEPAQAVGAPIITINQDVVFASSAWGRRVHADLERESKEIAAENDRLASQFATEEQDLTNLRGALPPDEFRKRADEFDKRVVAVRRERDQIERVFQARMDAERGAFFRAALPVLAQLMRDRGAQVVLDQSAIFVAAQSIDVTDELIARLDKNIGAGPAPEAPATPEAQRAPETP
ncbi:MAG: OmpH family outer membrane protein [Paracoccus sp. (in: a-proteobacteria)]|uniref:OmpH family outer membrane protein n=1 Tax=Paracoccus sp. TaxID=267 RepID=UPI0039E2368E